MIITGISADQFKHAIKQLSEETYHGNLRAEIGRVYSDNRFSARIVANDSGARMYKDVREIQKWAFDRDKISAPGARKSSSGRRIPAACWHAYRDGIMAVFNINPNARVQTAMAVYRGLEGFLNEYPYTAYKNIGSMMQPAYMPQLCDCDLHGIDTRENG